MSMSDVLQTLDPGNNYRPVSNLSVLVKVFESLVSVQLKKLLKSNIQ